MSDSGVISKTGGMYGALFPGGANADGATSPTYSNRLLSAFPVSFLVGLTRDVVVGGIPAPLPPPTAVRYFRMVGYDLDSTPARLPRAWTVAGTAATDDSLYASSPNSGAKSGGTTLADIFIARSWEE